MYLLIDLTSHNFNLLGSRLNVTNIPTELNTNVTIKEAVSSNDFPVIGTITTDVCGTEPAIQEYSPVPRLVGTSTWLREFVMQKRAINTYTYNITMPGLDLYPLSNWKSLSSVDPVLRTVQFFRGDIDLEFVVTGSPTALGALLVYATPECIENEYLAGVATDIDTGSDLFCRASQFPHIIIDINKSGSCKMKLPYFAGADFYYGATTFSGWKLSYRPLHLPTQYNGETADDIKISLYMSITNFESRGLQKQMLSTALGGAADALEDKEYQVASVTARLGKHLADRLGYGRPLSEPSTQMIGRSVGGMSNMVGSGDDVYHFAPVENTAHIAGDAHMPGESNIGPLALAQKESLLYHEVVGSRLYYIGPALAVVDVHRSSLEPPALTVASSTFKNYSGSIKVTLKFYSCALIRRRYAINVYPNGPIAGVTSFISNGSLPFHVFDVVGSTEFSFLVPYWQSSRYTGFDIQKVNPDGTVPLSLGATPAFRLFEITGSVGVDPYVDCWVSAGPDFELVHPSLHRTSHILYKQGMGEDIYGEQPITYNTLAKRCSINYLASSDAHETVYSFPADGFVRTGTNFSFAPLFTTSVFWTWYHWARSIHYASSGGTIHRTIVSKFNTTTTRYLPTDDGTFAVAQGYHTFGVQPNDTTGTIYNSFGEGFQIFHLRDVAEVMVQDRNPDQYKPLFSLANWDTTGDSYRETYDIVSPSFEDLDIDQQIRIEDYISGAEDVKFSMYVPPIWTWV